VLFDLKGRRRRVVQATYLMLAVLMGGGLVFFGIGGDVSGGLFDAFSDSSSSSSNQLVEDRIDKNEDKVAANPKDTEALQALVRDRYQLATAEADPNTRQFTDEGKEQLAESAEAWQLYLDAEKKPEPSLASLMVQVYSPAALNKPAEGAEAAEIVAVDQKSAQAYLQLVQFAALAGQDRKADLAGIKAIELAPKDQRSTVKTLVEQAKQPAASTTTQPAE
jgi:hypothetical protein